MTPNQQRFVDEYVIDLNATQAAIRAGYSPKTADRQGERLLRNVEVSAAIAKRLRAMSEQSSITADRVFREYVAIAFADLADFFDFSEKQLKLREANTIPEATRRAIQSIKVKRQIDASGDEVEVIDFKFWNKLEALKEVAARLKPAEEKNQPIRLDVTSGGKPIDPSANLCSLLPAALLATARSLGLEVEDLPSDGGSKPVDPAGSEAKKESETTRVPPPL